RCRDVPRLHVRPARQGGPEALRLRLAGEVSDGLGGGLAEPEAGELHHAGAMRAGAAAGLLAGGVALALEVPDRGGGGAAAGAAADRAGLLSPAGSGAVQPTGPGLRGGDGRIAPLLLCRPAAGLGPVQPSLRRAALRGGVFGGGSPPGRGLLVPGCLAP